MKKIDTKKIVRVEAPIVLTPEQIVAIAGGMIATSGKGATKGILAK